MRSCDKKVTEERGIKKERRKGLRLMRFLAVTALMSLLLTACLGCAMLRPQRAEVLTPSAISEERWSGLDAEERLAWLGAIAEEECAYLGIETVRLKSDILAENVRAQCRTTRRGKSLIIVNRCYLEDCLVEDAVYTVCHEVRHAFQSRTVSLLDWNDPAVKNNLYFRELLAWKENLENYETALETDLGDRYSLQVLELDANAYAEERTKIWCYTNLK